MIRNVALYRLFTTWIQLKLFAVQFTPDSQSLTSKEFSHHFFVRVINAAYNCNSNIMRCTLSLFAKVNLIMLFLLKRQQNRKKNLCEKQTYIDGVILLVSNFVYHFVWFAQWHSKQQHYFRANKRVRWTLCFLRSFMFDILIIDWVICDNCTRIIIWWTKNNRSPCTIYNDLFVF